MNLEEQQQINSYAVTDAQLEALVELEDQTKRAQFVALIRSTQSPLVAVEKLRKAFHKSYSVTQDELEQELLRLSQQQASEIRPGDISTYPTGPWPEGTVERVKQELGRLSQQQSTELPAAE